MWKALIDPLLDKAGIKKGDDIIINDESAYKDIVLKGSLGLGESYMQGKWDSPHLDTVITRLLEGEYDHKSILGTGVKVLLSLKSRLINLQTKKYAPDLYETHYNAGNFLFESFLDPNMIYTCAYFQNTDDLAQAQLDKIKIIGKKLDLKKGDKVLDIGCGWGGTARILSELFDVHVTGVADAPNQIAYAKKHNQNDNITFLQADYRDIQGTYDKIYNVGFLEAVGPKNFGSFMKQVDGLLNDDGIFLTHTIGGQKPAHSTEAWLDKYIFPHGVIPSKEQIDDAIKGVFEERDFEQFGNYYDTTLLKWNDQFNENWHTIQDQFNNPNSFKRMMNYYFLCCAATFRMGKNDLWHLVYTKPGQVKDYEHYRLPAK